MSEKEAMRISDKLTKDTCIISITSPTERDVVFADNPYIKKIFRMKFYDITHSINEAEAPKSEDFLGLKEFVDTLPCDNLIVHCGAGISRSAATAAAIMDYLGIEHNLFTDNRHSPNPLVYKLVQEAFGISKGEHYYNDIFNQIKTDEEIEL